MTPSLTEIFLRNCPSDREYAFRKYLRPDSVLTKFTPEEWQKIVCWINSDEELLNMMGELPYSLAALSYYQKKTGKPLCFLLLFRDHPHEKDTISFHGGGWSGPFVHLRCGKQLIQALRLSGFKVRTSVKTNNRRAQRFVEFLGLKKVTRREDTFWYYLPAERVKPIN